MGYLHQISPLRALWWRGGRKIESQWGWKIPRKQCLPETRRLVHRWTHRDIDSTHKSKQMEISALRRESGHYLPTLTQKLAPTDNYSQRKKSFSPIESHWVYKLHFNASSWQQQTHPTQKKLNGAFWRIFCLINALSEHALPYWSFACILWFLILWFFGFYVCVWVHVSLHSIYVFCIFYYFICLVFF